MANDNIRPFNINDQYIKKGLDELASDISVPDMTQAYNQFKKRSMKRSILKPVIAAALFILLIVSTVPGPAAAFRNQIRTTISQMVSDTVSLFQRTGSKEKEIKNVENKTRNFYSLEELKNEEPTGIFIPVGLQDNQFVQAEVVYNSDEPRKVIIKIDNNGTFLTLDYFILNDKNITNGRVFDIEDFDMDTIIVNGRRISRFFDNQGYTLLEWETEKYLFMLDGNLPVDEITQIGLNLGFFN